MSIYLERSANETGGYETRFTEGEPTLYTILSFWAQPAQQNQSNPAAKEILIIFPNIKGCLFISESPSRPSASLLKSDRLTNKRGPIPTYARLSSPISLLVGLSSQTLTVVREFPSATTGRNRMFSPLMPVLQTKNKTRWTEIHCHKCLIRLAYIIVNAAKIDPDHLDKCIQGPQKPGFGIDLVK